MLDECLKVDPTNEKALLRKVQSYIEMGDHERATKTLKILEQ